MYCAFSMYTYIYQEVEKHLKKIDKKGKTINVLIYNNCS